MLQKHREALFDLLTLAIYADAHISLTEESLLESAFIAEGWEAEFPKSLYIDQAFARARVAAESDEATANYIKERAGVFTDKGSQIEVCGVIRGILARDGLATGDSKFLEQLQAALPAAE